jgi:glycosyltransferase involved in cell wall biosynthesis
VWSLAQVLAQRGAEFDIVWASRHAIAQSLAAAVHRYAPRALFVFDTVDLHFVREAREAEVTRSADLASLAALTRQKELDIVRTADVTVVVSEAEHEILMEAVPRAVVQVLSTIHEPDERRTGFVERRDIFFVGGFNHPPNVDAADWYANAVWPLVRARLPEVRTFLIGSNMPARVRALAGNGIEPLGHVPSLDPYLDGCRLSIAPLRFGAGIKGKINTAHARGVPVVATTIAVEGMHLEHGRDVLVADTAQQFADAIVRLYSDASLWISISEAALANVRRHFSPEVAAQSLEQLLALAATKRAQWSRPDVTSQQERTIPPAAFERVARNPFILGNG